MEAEAPKPQATPLKAMGRAVLIILFDSLLWNSLFLPFAEVFNEYCYGDQGIGCFSTKACLTNLISFLYGVTGRIDMGERIEVWYLDF